MKRASKLPGPLYLDSSAFVKVYLPEPESERVETVLSGRRDLFISDLTITETTSALARKRREGIIRLNVIEDVRREILGDVEEGVFRRLDLGSEIFREAERILIATESVSLRAADSLHLALAIAAGCKSVLTFDGRFAQGALTQGLHILEPAT